MAGRGPAPKDPAQRRRRNEPMRGEWMDLPAKVDRPILPDLPERSADWPARTVAAWSAWRDDPATTQYGPAEIQAVTDLAFAHAEWVEGRSTLAGEVRLRMDGLGLTPKGKRDLRWRIPALASVEDMADRRKTKSASERMQEMRKRASSGDSTA